MLLTYKTAIRLKFTVIINNYVLPETITEQRNHFYLFDYHGDKIHQVKES